MGVTSERQFIDDDSFAADSPSAVASQQSIKAYIASVGVGTFVGLTDTPANYTSQALKIVRVNAGETGLEYAAAGTGDALVANSLAQFAATTSAELLGVISDETGTGALVFATSPTLVTPALGTPASGVMTNVSGTAASLTAGAVTNATLTTALTVNTGALTLTANADNTSVLTIGAGAVSVSGANTGDQTNISGNAGTVTTITGLAPDTATTAAAQANITSLGTLTTLTVDDITINGNTISSAGASTLAINPTAGQTITFDSTITLDAGVITGATSITSTAFVGALTGQADTVATITGLAPDTATTQATQGNITTIANLVTVGALDSGSITSGFGAINNGASNITTTGDISGGGILATGDTSAGDAAAIGYTATEGIIITGQGSSKDITFKNDADQTVLTLSTGGRDWTFDSDIWLENNRGITIGNTSRLTTDVASELQVLGTVGADSSFLIARFSADAVGPTRDFLKSRNAVIGSQTIVSDNDVVGSTRWFPDDGVDLATEAATFHAEVDDTSPAAGDVGMAFVWKQMPGGAGAIAESMRLAADGTLSVVGDISGAAITATGLATLVDITATTARTTTDMVTLDGDTLTTGNILLAHNTISGSSLANRSAGNNLVDISSSRTETRTTGTTADDYDLMSLARSNIMNGAGGTMTAAGSVLKLEVISTPTAGTLTDTTHCLELVQDSGSTGDTLNASGGTFKLINKSALSADEEWSGYAIEATSGYTQTVGDLVYIDPTDSRWEAVDPSAAAGADGDARSTIGLVVVAGTDGNACTILLNGVMRSAAFPAFTINEPLYAADAAGDISHTQPSTTDDIVRVVGFALSATDLHFCPSSDNVTVV